MLETNEIIDKKIWEEFISKNSSDVVPFFQTWNWIEVQKKRGIEVLRIGFFENKKLVGICAIVVVRARRGEYLHLRHGPVLANFQKDFDFCTSEIKKIAKSKKVSFIRLSPLIKRTDLPEAFFKKRGFINAQIHKMDAEVCWVLDATKPEETLLKEMRKSHRYLIRKAEGMGIEITKSDTIRDAEEFLLLYKDLSKRKGFVAHMGILEELEIFGEDKEALLFLAHFDEKIIAGALIIFLDKMAIYHHAATEAAYRNIPASYLIQWEVIKEVKKRGIPLYNFWGVVTTSDSKRHPWQGLSLFKTGFGGEMREFIHAQDLPLSPLYVKTHLIDLISRIKKGY